MFSSRAHYFRSALIVARSRVRHGAVFALVVLCSDPIFKSVYSSHHVCPCASGPIRIGVIVTLSWISGQGGKKVGTTSLNRSEVLNRQS